jgi:hypothetical protein
MNRSILIVICDFLLVSLLVFSNVDINKAVEEGRTVPITAAVATNHVDAGTDLTSVMRLALQEEQKRREALVGELARTRETASEREKRIQNYEQELRAREQQQNSLLSQFNAAQTNIQTLAEQVRLSSTDATISKEKLAAMEAELKKRAEEAAALQQQLAGLSQSNQFVLNSNQQLSARLQVAEVERRHAAEQATALTEQVKVEREEKAKLAEGVKTLAAKSTELTQEIRENRALSPNTIFDEFTTNRVRAAFNAFRSGLFDTNKRRDTGTILVSDGTNAYALCHVDDTPLTIWNPGTQWEGLTGTLTRGTMLVPIHSLSFHLQDPRIVFMPITAAEAKQLGGQVYRVSNTPFKFQDAVLIGASASYYGECKFEIDPSAPEYLKLDRNFLKGLFGKFNPSRGDFVFSKTGDLLGIMANNTYCLRIQKFVPSATFQFGPDIRNQRTGDTLASLYNVVQQMPFKLQ